MNILWFVLECCECLVWIRSDCKQMIGWSQSEDDSTQRAHSTLNKRIREEKGFPEKFRDGISGIQRLDPPPSIPVSPPGSHTGSRHCQEDNGVRWHIVKKLQFLDLTPGDLDNWTFIQPATIRSNPTHFHIRQLSSQVQQNNFSFLDVGCDERLDEDIGGQNDESKSPVFLITGNKPCCYINLYYSEGETNNKTQTEMDYPTNLPILPSSS